MYIKKTYPVPLLNESLSNNAVSVMYVFFLVYLCISTNLFAREYEIPPSGTTSANVPWISDEAMEQCVKLYNEAKWLSEGKRLINDVVA